MSGMVFSIMTTNQGWLTPELERLDALEAQHGAKDLLGSNLDVVALPGLVQRLLATHELAHPHTRLCPRVHARTQTRVRERTQTRARASAGAISDF